MKKKRRLRVYGDRHHISVAVGYVGSRLAIAWFWDTPDGNALKNAKEYVRWKNAHTSAPS